mgnify:FL=1
MVARARTACEAWQRDAEDNSRKANIAEKQRDEVLKITFLFIYLNRESYFDLIHKYIYI